MELLAGQCRAARALLSWSQNELGQRARVDQKTIADFERGTRNPHPRTIEALVKALEDAGVVFVEPTAALYSGVALKTDVVSSQHAAASSGDTSEAGPSISAAGAAWDEG
jgi:transcriptional regulator with XRE-family HTH domain